jgi:hypothetical protein
LSIQSLSTYAPRHGTPSQSRSCAVPWCHIHPRRTPPRDIACCPHATPTHCKIQRCNHERNWMDHKSDIALLLPHHLLLLTHSRLKLHGSCANVAFSCCRYEGALCYRSLDLKEATATSRHAVVQNGTQGMYRNFRSCIVCLLQSPCPSHPFHPCNSPCFLAYLTGDAGKLALLLHTLLHAVCAPPPLLFVARHAAVRISACGLPGLALRCDAPFIPCFASG